MSNLDSLQDFIEKQRRNPDLGPLKRETVDNRGAAEKDKDMLAETTRAMAEDRDRSSFTITPSMSYYKVG